MRNHLKASRHSMDKLTSLVCVPDVTCDEDTLEDLEELRTTPMEGERRRIFAIQTGDNEASRQPLPTWVATPIERALSKWVEDHQYWMEKVDDRAICGKSLTPSDQKRYDDWCHNAHQVHLLFNKRSKRIAPPPRKNASLARMKKELICVTLNLSMEASELSLQAGMGEPRRLVILQGQPQQFESTEMPEFMDEALGAGVEAVLEAREQAEEACDSDNMEEIDGRLDEDEELLRQDMDMDMDVPEVLAYSSEEECLASILPGEFVRVKTFAHRMAYQKLDALNLTALPPVRGVHISYHQSTRSWTAWYPGRCSQGMCYSHGGSTKRSEPEALLMCIKALLTAHTEANPRDFAWRAQLDKLLAAEASIASF